MIASAIAVGGILIVLGIIGYVYPITSAGSASDINDLCNSAIGQFGKILSSDVRENCQYAKYFVVGSYVFMGIGALLVIVGSIAGKGDASSGQVSQPISPATKRTIGIGVGIAAAIVIGVTAYQLSLQPDIQVADFNVRTNQNQQFVKVYDLGRVSTTGNFYYTSPKDSSYYLVFSNDFSIISTKYVGAAYTDKEREYSQTFQIPAGSYKSIPVYAYSGQSVRGAFNVAGGSGDDVDFYIATSTCSQNLSFSFNLSNYGPVNGNAQASLQSDGKSIWSNTYFVETRKQITESGTTTISDCNQHDLKMIVTVQKKT